MGATSDLYNTKPKIPKIADPYIPFRFIKTAVRIFGQTHACKEIVIYTDPSIKIKGMQRLICKVTNYVQTNMLILKDAHRIL